MKYVRLIDGIVTEILPEFDADFPGLPIRERYAPEFLIACIHVKDGAEVCTGMRRDPETGAFAFPPAEATNEAQNHFT